MKPLEYELLLGDERLTVPWGGRSPRSLTKCAKLLIRKECPTGGPILDADPAQLTMFLKGTSIGS